ncbi:NAD(P)-dependent oxidoreductase [Ammoniphilus sp. YIM 78166]|uniref:NAD(P)-dependent oxidoreductase n=1 Tax=Ammoniphilus sp. YIM 78166 TaxID=1644106 RepID=UPI0010706858|nr:NAD(P)-dependent oxidoreductase [Ammoniphilus sp. YIM 78166]
MRIGFSGLGRMGFAIAERLMVSGFELAVWNRTKHKAQHLVARGVSWVDSPKDLTERCDIILSIVTDDHAVHEIYTNANGLLQSDCHGKLFLEMSTIKPQTIHGLAEMVQQKGGRLLDCPVSGTVVHAREGQLIAMIGGDSDSVEKVKPVLSTFCKSVNHIGPIGTGSVMKLVLNMPMVIYTQALSEALSIGVKAGIDLKYMLELIMKSPAGINVLPVKIPVMLGETEEVSFDIKGFKKDLLNMISTSQLYEVPAPTASVALQSYSNAVADGFGDLDWGAIIPYYIKKMQNSSK